MISAPVSASTCRRNLQQCRAEHHQAARTSCHSILLLCLICSQSFSPVFMHLFHIIKATTLKGKRRKTSWGGNPIPLLCSKAWGALDSRTVPWVPVPWTFSASISSFPFLSLEEKVQIQVLPSLSTTLDGELEAGRCSDYRRISRSYIGWTKQTITWSAFVQVFFEINDKISFLP